MEAPQTWQRLSSDSRGGAKRFHPHLSPACFQFHGVRNVPSLPCPPPQPHFQLPLSSEVEPLGASCTPSEPLLRIVPLHLGTCLPPQGLRTRANSLTILP